ncbi:MAG TPA: NAD(P)/FAD-dependent oxidoreductase [Anaerolineales bacterium]|nr:NAD(P)/FAD-dependent oxidoreductase [Anaerolineales bacterium]
MQYVPIMIIGAGPAGLSTALHLVQHHPGWKDRLILLERAAHPRHKLCGGGVTRMGLDILRGLGMPAPLPVPQVSVEDVRLVYDQRVIHVRGRPEFVIFHRQELDAYLANEARQRGLTILENETAKSFEWRPDGIKVTTTKGEYLAQVIVGADGSKGITRRLVGGRTNPSRVARLLEVIHPAPATAPQFKERYAIFDFSKVRQDLQGYAWDFPAQVKGKPHFNRGIYDARLWTHRPRARLPILLDKALSEMGTDLQQVKIEGHPIHCFTPDNHFSTPRVVLVGDAAGADPLFGEGIAPALAYGQIAARAIHRAFAKNDFSFQDYWQRIFFSQLGGYLLFRWWVSWWAYQLSDQAWYMHLFWTIAGGLAALKRR